MVLDEIDSCIRTSCVEMNKGIILGQYENNQDVTMYCSNYKLFKFGQSMI